jgi:hypothetical protein
VGGAVAGSGTFATSCRSQINRFVCFIRSSSQKDGAFVASGCGSFAFLRVRLREVDEGAMVQRPAEYGIAWKLLSRVEIYSSGPLFGNCHTTRITRRFLLLPAHCYDPSRNPPVAHNHLSVGARYPSVADLRHFCFYCLFRRVESSIGKEQRRWFRGGRRRDWNGRSLALLRCKLLRISLYRRSYHPALLSTRTIAKYF